LLDTNICSAHLKRPAGLMHRFIQHSGRLHIPSRIEPTVRRLRISALGTQP
jgi:hypothetical protein